MASIVAEVGIDGKKFDSGLKSIMSGITGMKGGFGQLAGAVGIAGIAFGVISTQMKKAVDITVTYADEVRTLASITNQSAEETSRMIQVLDDYKLTSQQAGMAARFLAKEGLSLNIETLAKLSDEYKALNTGQERSTFLMKNFGKAGQDFALIMDQGSDAILKQGDAVNKSLILSGKQLKATRDLEIALDDLEDAQQGMYVQLGSKLIPLQVKATEWFTNGASAALGWGDQIRTIAELLTQQANPALVGYGVLLQSVWGEQTNVNDSLSEADIIAQRLSKSTLPTLEDRTEDLGIAMSGIGDSGAEMAAGMIQASLAADGVLDEDDVQTLLDFRLEMGLLTQEQYDAAQETIRLKGAIEGLPAEKQIDISIYYHTYGFMPGQLLSNNKPINMSFGVEPSSVGSSASAYSSGASSRNTTSTSGNAGRQANGGPVNFGGWTMVGEQGFELIDPSGMVHSNPDSKKLIKAGVTPFKKLLTGGELGGDPYHWPKPSGGYNFSDDAAMMGMPGIPQNWIDNYNSKTGGKSSGSSAVIQTAAAASQSASQAAQQTSRAVDVTAQMSTQMASSSAAQMASLASIDRRLANLPSQLRDVFQQVIQQ